MFKAILKFIAFIFICLLLMYVYAGIKVYLAKQEAEEFCEKVAINEPLNKYIELANQHDIPNQAYGKNEYRFHFHAWVFSAQICKTKIEKGIIKSKEVYFYYLS